MVNDSSIQMPRWLLIPRLITFVLISGIVIFGLNYPNHLKFFYFAYAFITLLLPAIFIFHRHISLTLLSRFIPHLQTFCEIVVVSSIVYTTGNINSAFSGLFVLTIISAALTNRLAGTLSYATIVSVVFSFIIWYGMDIVGQPGSSMRALENIFHSRDAAFYSIFLHILTFYLIAFVSGFLVERLKAKDKQLADTSQALRQARLETDDILKHLNSGLLTIDPYGRIIYFNRAAEDILGYKEVDLKGKNFKDMFEARMPALVENLQKVLISQEHSQRSEVDISDSMGNPVPIGISTSPLADGGNRLRGIIAIFQDLTETKKMEAKIRSADRLAAVGELSAAIAHEIRNPLAAISGSVEVMKAALDLSDDDQTLMDLIIRESNRLNNILSDFLLYARINRSVFNRVELCHLIGDVMEIIRHQPGFDSMIDFQLKSSESIIYIFSDEDQIKQILINLIINSYQALHETGGKIVVQIDKEESGRAIMRIIDNGPGIEPEVQARMFDPFYSTKKDGTGLGLAIVQRLCSELKIELSLRSHLGEGTTFCLKFNHIPQKSGNIEYKVSRPSVV